MGEFVLNNEEYIFPFNSYELKEVIEELFIVCRLMEFRIYFLDNGECLHIFIYFTSDSRKSCIKFYYNEYENNFKVVYEISVIVATNIISEVSRYVGIEESLVNAEIRKLIKIL